MPAWTLRTPRADAPEIDRVALAAFGQTSTTTGPPSAASFSSPVQRSVTGEGDRVAVEGARGRAPPRKASFFDPDWPVIRML